MIRSVFYSLLLSSVAVNSYSVEIDKKSLQKELAEYNFFSKMPGSILSICQGDDCFEITAGVSDPAKETPIAADSRVKIGSLSKTMTATMILQAVDDGLIDLDDPLDQYLPQYDKWGEVTVRQLLRMQSGIPPYLFDKDSAFGLIENFIKGENKLYKPKNLLDGIKDKELMYSPGTISVYNNTNYVLLGLILEQVRKEKYENLLQEFIVEPLGLENTYLNMNAEPDPTLAPGFLQNHEFGLPPVATLLFPWSSRRAEATFDITHSLPPSLAWSAGGLVSSPRDMNRFMVALLNGKLTSQQSLEAMKDFVSGSVGEYSLPYGLGLMAHKSDYGRWYGHGGVGMGYQSTTYYLPEEDIGIALVQNVGPASTYQVFDSLINSILGNTQFRELDLSSFEDNYSPYNGLHVRVNGRIKDPNSFQMISPVGYAFDHKRFITGQSYNNVSANARELEQGSFISFDIASNSSFGMYLSGPTEFKPVAKVYVSSSFLESSNNPEMPAYEGKFTEESLFAVTGYEGKDENGQIYTCSKRIIDYSRLALVQVGSNIGSHFQVGESVKFLGNIPLRNSNTTDNPLLEKFGFKHCNFFRPL